MINSYKIFLILISFFNINNGFCRVEKNRVLHPLECGRTNRDMFREYSLVSGKDKILISHKAESLGATWNNGIIWDKPCIEKFYELLYMKRREPFVVLDIGAQTGVFSLLAKFFPLSKCWAFEPITEAALLLEQHCKINSISNVTVIECAVSDSCQDLELKLPLHDHWGLATLGSKPKRFEGFISRKISSISLDFFFKNLVIERLDFIKIDTEGWEYYVLQGAKNLILRHKPIILLEFNIINMAQCNIDSEDLLNLLESMGYSWSFFSSEDILCIPDKI
jgi:FkbM family methyltransferase